MYPEQRYKQDIVKLRGLNLTDSIEEGDLCDTKNISSSRYPFITTENAKTKKTGAAFTNVKALASYKTPVTFANGKVNFNGQALADIPSNEKRLTIVNNNLCVFPDRRIVKLSDFFTASETSPYEKPKDKFYNWLDSNGVWAVGTHTFTKNSAGWTYLSVPSNTLNGAISDLLETIGVPDVNYASDDKIRYSISIKETNGTNMGQKLSGYSVHCNGDEMTLYKSGWSNYTFVDSSITANQEELRKGFKDYSSNLRVRSHYGIFEYYKYSNGRETIISTSYGAPGYKDRDITRTYYITNDESETDTGYIIQKQIDVSQIFKVGDTINFTVSGVNYTGTIQAITKEDDNYKITFTTSLFTSTITSYDRVEISTSDTASENFDYTCEWNNRLWACSSEKHIIYASALGKPSDFVSDMGLSVGAYQCAVGDIENFTGCTKYESSILFFKQNKIYKILGDSPKDYAIYTYEAEGVKVGCDKSICTINGILYYVGLHGVYAYSGGSPVLISNALGNIDIDNAVGGTDGEKYYLSFTSGEINYLMCYEPKYNMWLKIENTKVVDFARVGEDLIYCDDLGNVYTMNTGDLATSDDWYAQFTPFYETIEGKKRHSKFKIRFDIPKGSYAIAKIRLDGKLWKEVGRITGKGEGVETMVLPIGVCDKFELRLEGQGKCTIKEILREFEIRSDK